MSLNTCITSARPTTQAIGNPFPIALPKQARSGTTPNRFCAPPRPKWKPLQISSKISNAPCWCARSFTPARKPGAGSTKLKGSRITAANSPGCSPRIRSRLARSLYTNECVNARTAGGTPAWRVVLPIYQSCHPWYPQQATRSRLVKARAARTAPEVASDPFLPKRTISAQGMSRVSRSACSTSSGCGSEKLCPSASCAEMVRFGKNGSDATSGAVRAARAFTRRDRVACCGYHGWQDWYIGSTTRHAGVPPAVRALTHSFVYNDLASLERILGEHPGEFAAVILEPFNFVEPAPGFLAGVKDLAHQHGALLIFDEICSGFHFGLGGAQKRFGVVPDLACFGKAMGNGFPIACVVGRAEVMQVFNDIFYSFTFAGELSSIAAAMKVLDILERTDALARLHASGRRLQDGLNAMAKEAGLGEQLKATADPRWSLLKFRDREGNDSALVKNLFQQEAVKRGILLLATHNLSAAHDGPAIQQTLEAYAEVIKTLAEWLRDPHPERFLEGPMSQPVFKVR